VNLTAGILSECRASPCMGQLAIEIDPILPAGAPRVTIDGTVTVDVFGPSEDPDDPAPAGTQLDVDVVPRIPS
jgi:hypothetical protein